jgi:hypothetical protein
VPCELQNNIGIEQVAFLIHVASENKEEMGGNTIISTIKERIK